MRVACSGARRGWLAPVLLAALAAHAQDEGPTGTVRQPLVAGQPVAAAAQQEFGLVTLESPSGDSSAVLLTNEWVVTAAHCVEEPDPARPGQVLVPPAGSFTLFADWEPAQERTADQVETFRPYDLAILHVSPPFTLHGQNTGYRRLVFLDGQFPYFGHPVGVPILAFGRGIHTLAQGEGATATPAQRDGQWRSARFTTNRQDDTRYYFPAQGGQMIAGGDSGGPSFAWVLGGWALVGVHSHTAALCLPGKVCGRWPGPGPEPADYSPWAWVASTPEAGDAPLAPSWPRIAQRLRDTPPPPPPPLTLEQTTPFAPPGTGYRFAVLYGLTPDGRVLWYRHDSRTDGGGDTWQGPRDMQVDWSGYRQVLPGGGGLFYGVRPDGSVDAWRHAAFATGLPYGARLAARPGAAPGSGVRLTQERLRDRPRDPNASVRRAFTPAWDGPTPVATGWGGYTRLLGGGEGVVYGVTADGRLEWRRHLAATGGPDTWQGPITVGVGWGEFTVLFGQGDGVIYGQRADGELAWYRHHGWADGRGVESPGAWEGPRPVRGFDWSAFRQLVPAGGGGFYAIEPDGSLLWLQHKTWLRGASAPAPAAPGLRLAADRPYRPGLGREAPAIARLGEWDQRPVGSGWNQFHHVVALLPRQPDPVR